MYDLLLPVMKQTSTDLRMATYRLLLAMQEENVLLPSYSWAIYQE